MLRVVNFGADRPMGLGMPVVTEHRNEPWTVGTESNPSAPGGLDDHAQLAAGNEPRVQPAAAARVELATICWPRLVGRSLLWLGALMVAFAAFQLWGTGLIERRAQRDINAELALRLPAPASAPGNGDNIDRTEPVQPAPAPTPAPGQGQNAVPTDPEAGSALIAPDPNRHRHRRSRRSPR